MKQRKALICQCCGATEFERTQQDGREVLKCKYCGCQYEPPEETEEIEVVSHASVNGTKLVGDYVVYETMDVGGIKNRIILTDIEPENATHVKCLEVRGVKNTLRVKLMPGATKNVAGINNTVN